MLKKILTGLGGFLVAFVAVVATQPGAYKVTRTTNIAAPPEAVFNLINDFHQWEGWSPWAKLDPTMKTTYSGAPTGPGAKYHWLGNSEVGEGRMTILSTEPPNVVKVNLEFIKPFESESITTFRLAPDGTGTRVEWMMEGQSVFLMKAFMLFTSMDSTVGPDFERGLSQMKQLAEAKK
ncbi:MAG: SRPBCC family protein [Acidobacteria bacterium]|nr:SRPBCC family protein [Acidobacteriota bacterium]